MHGAAVGGGLGLAMVADFRVACTETRFCANFTRLGFHPGFGLTVTLPQVIGAVSYTHLVISVGNVMSTFPATKASTAVARLRMMLYSMPSR